MRIPIWPCSEWGFTIAITVASKRGALLPHHFTLTTEKFDSGILSVALSVNFRLPGIAWHSALWSPDFPLRCTERLSSWLNEDYTKIGI